MSIPNIIHFIFYNKTEFRLLHYLSIITAKHINQPDKIYLYNSQEPSNNIYWNNLKYIDNLEIIHVQEPTHIQNTPLNHYQQKADVTRLEKLIRRGGIYLDLDILSVRSLQPLIKQVENTPIKCIIGIEDGSISDIKSISNDIIFIIL